MQFSRMGRGLLPAVVGACLFAAPVHSGGGAGQDRRAIQILFLGHNSKHHDSARYAPMLAAALAPDGIDIAYTAEPNDLNTPNLASTTG